MIEAKARRGLGAVVEVVDGRCANCHTCISVCPAKYCIDGSGEKVRLDAERCIGCGSCVRACPHGARRVKDDAAAFFEALARGERPVAIAAPALVSSYPGTWPRILGWLRRLGVEAFFDVGFGAELTVKSYLEHLRRDEPRLVIAQPCPAVVTWIELYAPELLPHLAPADSPMLHTVKLIREFYPRFRERRLLVLSPCAAKRREFDETGLGDWNLTFASLDAALRERRVELACEAEAQFENPPVERALVFSAPGGLMGAAEREAPGIGARSRRIEGPELVYPYLAGLGASLAAGTAPLLVDCLNCATGCDRGSGTLDRDKRPDDRERPVEERPSDSGARHAKPVRSAAARGKVDAVLSRYWRPGLYARTYVDRSAVGRVRRPGEAELAAINARMEKAREEDFLNCSSCGYGSCADMAVAIHNGLNKPENCHLLRRRHVERGKAIAEEGQRDLSSEAVT